MLETPVSHPPCHSPFPEPGHQQAQTRPGAWFTPRVATRPLAVTAAQPVLPAEPEVPEKSPDFPPAARWKQEYRVPDLGCTEYAPGIARDSITSVLAYEWNLGSFAYTVSLIVSELVTNGVKANVNAGLATVRYPMGKPVLTPENKSPWVAVRMLTDGSRVLIEVWDPSDAMPVARDPGEEDENGRGLMLTEALSEESGCYAGTTGGTVIWALVTEAQL